MDPLPLHPALVHLPLGIAFVLPLLGFGVVFSTWRGWLPRQAWVGVVLVSALAFGTALTAQEAGEKDARRVAEVVGRAAVHRHEQAAEGFTAALGVLTLLSGAALFARREAWFRALTAGLSLAWLGAMGAGFMAGRFGGELVYRPQPQAQPLPTPDGTVPRQAAE